MYLDVLGLAGPEDALHRADVVPLWPVRLHLERHRDQLLVGELEGLHIGLVQCGAVGVCVCGVCGGGGQSVV